MYELNTVNCSADKTTGYKGDTITITGTPAWNEKTSSYSVTGATLTGNQFDFTGSDVTAQANYETAKNVTLQTDGHGTISANKTSGFIGDTVTLANTANVGYVFSTYTLTGANLTGNQFNLTGSNVTAKATFTVNGVPVVDTTGCTADIALDASVFLDNYNCFAFMFEQYDAAVSTPRDNTMISANLLMDRTQDHIYTEDYIAQSVWPSTGYFSAIPYNHNYVHIPNATNQTVPVELDNTVWSLWTSPRACAIDRTPFDNQWHTYKYIVVPTYTMSNAQYICCKDYVPKVSGILGAAALTYTRFKMTVTGRGPTSAVKNLKARYFYTLEDALAWQY